MQSILLIPLKRKAALFFVGGEGQYMQPVADSAPVWHHRHRRWWRAPHDLTGLCCTRGPLAPAAEVQTRGGSGSPKKQNAQKMNICQTEVDPKSQSDFA